MSVTAFSPEGCLCNTASRPRSPAHVIIEGCPALVVGGYQNALPSLVKEKGEIHQLVRQGSCSMHDSDLKSWRPVPEIPMHCPAYSDAQLRKNFEKSLFPRFLCFLWVRFWRWIMYNNPLLVLYVSKNFKKKCRRMTYIENALLPSIR